jgi:hypothetical protein
MPPLVRRRMALSEPQARSAHISNRALTIKRFDRAGRDELRLDYLLFQVLCPGSISEPHKIWASLVPRRCRSCAGIPFTSAAVLALYRISESGTIADDEHRVHVRQAIMQQRAMQIECFRSRCELVERPRNVERAAGCALGGGRFGD